MNCRLSFLVLNVTLLIIIVEIFVRSTSIHAKSSYISICMHASSDNVVSWGSVE